MAAPLKNGYGNGPPWARDVGLPNEVYRDAIFPTHDYPDRSRRHGGRGFHADRLPAGIGPDRRKETHDHSFRFADHRQQGRHRRHAEDRPDLRYALYGMALRERPEGQEVRLFGRPQRTVRIQD